MVNVYIKKADLSEVKKKKKKKKKNIDRVHLYDCVSSVLQSRPVARIRTSLSTFTFSAKTERSISESSEINW